MRWERQAVVPLLVASALVACGGAQYHRVRRGETLWKIAQRYNVSVAALARINGVKNPHELAVGQRLRIPRGLPPAEPPPEIALVGRNLGRRLPFHQRELRRWRERFRWPVDQGVISSSFGVRRGSYHDGIDIQAPEGSVVRAAWDGEVIFAGSLRGYGKTVLLRHERGLVTLYAHQQRLSVQVGQRVRAGQAIGRVGDSGRTTGPNLHFEIRHENVALDPVSFLDLPQIAEPGRAFGGGG